MAGTVYGPSSNASAYPPNYITGLGLQYVSATQIKVGAGKCRDSADSQNLSLAALTTADITTIGAVNGLDTKTLTGTCDTNTANATITGTGTAFLTEFGTRALTGTIGTGGGASSTITGSSSAFLSEVSPGDLIGNATVGYARVTAIASDTSLTVVSNLTISNGSSGLVIENATLQVASQTAARVNAIASNTSLTISANSSATQSGQAAKAGVEVASCWYTAQVIQGASGEGTCLSTQRTTLFGISGYTNSRRRVGWVLNDSSGNILEFSHYAFGEYRETAWECGNTVNGTRVVSNGGSTSWVSYVASAVVPASSTYMRAAVVLSGGGSNSSAYWRPRNRGNSTVSRNGQQVRTSSAAENAGSLQEIGLDGAQAFDLVLTSGGSAGTYVDVAGYVDSMNVYP